MTTYCIDEGAKYVREALEKHPAQTHPVFHPLPAIHPQPVDDRHDP
jgi:hypothetical protein